MNQEFRHPQQRRALTMAQHGRAVVSWLGLALALAIPAWAQAPATKTESPGAATAMKIEAIAPADIPARADADEQFIQGVLRRTQVSDPTRRLEQSLATISAEVQQLAKQSASIDLSSFPELRLRSLLRYWLLHDRELAQWRGELQQATRLSSDDAAGLANRRAVWEASRAGASDSSSALLRRADEIIGQIDRAERQLSVPLGRMIELGRKGNTLWTQVQGGVTAARSRVGELDRQLGLVEAPPLWHAFDQAGPLAPVLQEFSASLQLEAAFRRAHDAANARLVHVLVACALLLLPVLLWLKRRAARMVRAGEPAQALGALARPWAAWLVLVALGVVWYDWQGPTFRQQVVMLLAWVPVLRLLTPRMLAFIGPWGYLSALFYFLIMVTSLLFGGHFWYRCLLLGIDVLMLSSLGWMALRGHAAGPVVNQPALTLALRVLAAVVAAVLLVAAGANLLGNVSLASMLTGALLDSNYMALAILAGARVVVALVRVFLSRPAASRLRESGRHSGSLIRAGANVGRTLLVVAWLVYALQAFRIYQPLLEWSTSILNYQFTLGELSVSLGGIVVLFGAGWLAFWLARTIRLVLSDEVLPSLSLPRGVDNTISTLSYYTVLFLGLMTALAAAGFKVGQLTLVLSALSVGIGFGLQDIVKNFVAGLILMFERPVQPGDLVDVAGVSGTVRDIGMRATTLRTADGADVVVPNGKLLADTLVNWTLSGSRRRFDISVSTAHNAPPQRTIELLTGIAGGFNDICTTPAPVAVLTALTPGALEFSLRVWTDRKDWGNLRSDLAVGLHDGLAKAGIEMPAP